MGVDILVATPGRLLDLWKQKKLDFGGVEYLVIDEADRMLDMGFIPDIRKIVAQLPKDRQSMLFSATLSDEIRTLASAIVNDPVSISVSPESPTVDKIDQSVAYLESQSKAELLEEILKKRQETEPDSLALIFCRTKHGANKLAKKLISRGIGSAAIHGNKSQSARKAALESFKSRKIRTLVATDIAARGIDVKDMSLVINFDLPEEAETYVHRIGRTARAEASGQAISFCTPDDGILLRQIHRYIKKEIPEFEDNPYRVDMPKSARPFENARGQSRRGGAARPQGGGNRRTTGGGSRQPRQNAPRRGASGEFGEKPSRNFARSTGDAPRTKGRREGGFKEGRAEAQKKSTPASSKSKGFFGFMKFGRKGK